MSMMNHFSVEILFQISPQRFKFNYTLNNLVESHQSVIHARGEFINYKNFNFNVFILTQHICCNTDF